MIRLVTAAAIAVAAVGCAGAQHVDVTAPPPTTARPVTATASTIQVFGPIAPAVEDEPGPMPTTTSTVAPAPAATAPRIDDPAPPPPSDEQLDALAMCESGMDPLAHGAETVHGRLLEFWGAFQFNLGTWRSLGTGYDHPWDAPYEAQRDAARALIAAPGKGWGHFPGCARKLGMR